MNNIPEETGAANRQADESMLRLLANNRSWAERIAKLDPDFFPRLAAQQSPEYLWIGCSDSRVPANEICGLAPGEIFVHRNIANIVLQSDLNCVSVIQYAVDVLKVRHIMVTGHYGCGGVHVAITDKRIGLADHWIAHVRAVQSRHEDLLAQEPHPGRREALLCELNAIEQAINVCRLPVMQDAWDRGQQVWVHAWVYGLRDGRVRDLGMSVGERRHIDSLRREAVAHWLKLRADEPSRVTAEPHRHG
jgi:carbonic anhydrase